MAQKKIESTARTGQEGLRELVTLAKEYRLVGKLAVRLGISRQAVYVWAGEGMLERSAVLRLVEISRLRFKDVERLVDFAKELLARLEEVVVAAEGEEA